MTRARRAKFVPVTPVDCIANVPSVQSGALPGVRFIAMSKFRVNEDIRPLSDLSRNRVIRESDKPDSAPIQLDSRLSMAAIILQVKVKPRARVSELTQATDGTWLAKLKAPPVDGKANTELVSLVAKKFQCRKAAVTIKAGASGRTKLVRVEEPS